MKIKIILLLLLLILFVQKGTCDIVCPAQSCIITEQENIIKKVTGLSFFSKKITETVIQKELKEALNSKFSADLEIFTISRLRKGEFKALTLRSKNIKYKAFSMSDFNAQTICPYNKVIYKKNRIYYPQELPFKYQGSITNTDIQNVINSRQFQKEINKIKFTAGGINALKIHSPNVQIKEDRIYFTIPAESILGNFKIKFNSQIGVVNNKIILKDISFSKKSNIINNGIIFPIINALNPITYEIKSINGKYCKIYITKAQIKSDKIETQGIFIINKNYGENE